MFTYSFPFHKKNFLRNILTFSLQNIFKIFNRNIDVFLWEIDGNLSVYPQHQQPGAHVNLTNKAGKQRSTLFALKTYIISSCQIRFVPIIKTFSKYFHLQNSDWANNKVQWYAYDFHLDLSNTTKIISSKILKTGLIWVSFCLDCLNIFD